MVVRVTPAEAQNLIANRIVEVVDVRDPEEWSRGHVPGARLVTLSQLRTAPRANLPRDGVLFVCAGGVRSETAGRIALEHGLTRVFSLVGGTASWVKAGYSLAEELRAAV